MFRSLYSKFSWLQRTSAENTSMLLLPIFLRSSRLLSVFLLLVVVDQLSKWWVGEVGRFMQLNQGVSFGLLAHDSGWLSGTVLLVVMIVLYQSFADFWHKHSTWSAVFFAGAFSNILDRFFVGGVRDWLAIPLTSLYNNLADWYIAVALIVVVLIEAYQYFTIRAQQST
jgi:lipoprotein signal peptidase